MGTADTKSAELAEKQLQSQIRMGVEVTTRLGEIQPAQPSHQANDQVIQAGYHLSEGWRP